MDGLTPDGSEGHHEDDESDENALVKLTSLVVLGAGLLGLFLGYEWFWLVFALGFAVVVPIVKVVTDEFGIGVGSGEATERGRRASRAGRRGASDRRRETDPGSKQDALDQLRERYARGELSDAEFERKVERLLETETLEGAREHVGREGTERAPPTGRAADETGPTAEGSETDDLAEGAER